MTGRSTLATTRRVLSQLKHDRRTIALIIVVPCVILGLIAWMFHGQTVRGPTGPPVIDQFGPMLLAIFPAVIMFLVTSVATQRERTSGTLERLMTTPLAKADFVFGYAIAFAIAAAVQATVVTTWAVWVCGMNVKGHVWEVVVIAVLDAVLGSTLGLAASSLARTEFQAVQMMPAIIIPQLVVCGLVMPRHQMPQVLQWISDVVPFTYAIEATNKVAVAGQSLVDAGGDVLLVLAFVALALGIGVATLRRRTP
ncbi:MAG: ABC transporter permease [Micrococcales bacterium]|nr:ABC transporter permease [Micrococcales bacterium]